MLLAAKDYGQLHIEVVATQRAARAAGADELHPAEFAMSQGNLIAHVNEDSYGSGRACAVSASPGLGRLKRTYKTSPSGRQRG